MVQVLPVPALASMRRLPRSGKSMACSAVLSTPRSRGGVMRRLRWRERAARLGVDADLHLLSSQSASGLPMDAARGLEAAVLGQRLVVGVEPRQAGLGAFAFQVESPS